MPFIDVENLDSIRESQPYFIYKRIPLSTTAAYFFHQIDYGFWYLLRKVYVKYPEIDVTGLIFGPRIRVESYQRGSNKIPQNVPIPFELFCTPGGNSVTVSAGGQMTATGPKNTKLQNVVYPYRDNIELTITGQNTITPIQVDIVLLGYLIPVNKLRMWEGGKNA
jgi:hypothetical protein